MAQIIVAGGGNGGLVSAIHLAKAGLSVTLFEGKEKSDVGLCQTDAVDISAFTYANIPIPDYFKRGKNEVTFIPKDATVGSLTLPPQSEISLFVDRKELANYLFDLAEKFGVKIHYGEKISSAVMLGNRVVGIKTEKGVYYADLVIDACGVKSPVRNSLPEYLNINRPIEKYDVVYSYRAYFNRIKDAPAPKTDYNIYFKEDGTTGFCWLVTEFDRVDALICRFYEPSDSEILNVLHTLHKENEQMGIDVVYGGTHGIIPVCQPLSTLVSDGYAAVGDSAFMTFAVKGSGIAYSMMAGKILADTIIADKNTCYSQETLWNYQRGFFKEIGFTACTIALIKNMLPFMTADDVNKLFELKIITTEELSALWENKTDAILNARGAAKIKDKIRLVRDEPILKNIFSNLAVWIAKFAVLQTSFPHKYNKEDIAEWNEKYNKFFQSIKRKDDFK